uniref:B30.2/SPRY domain-containing protein n=1 Tax=Scophthalmus maximus TaxID=52904 RepID=A0A8D3CEB7_SCOMX
HELQSSSLEVTNAWTNLQKHNMPFFRSYGSTQARARAQTSLSEPQPLSGALIDVAQHLGNLSFRVREKMKEKVQLSPVILDPNTAHSYVETHVSSSLTIHRDSRYPTVLGSEGFSSGKHSWEVKVGDHPQWNIGFAKQSVVGKGELFASPKYGIWCLWLLHGKYTNGNSVTVTMKKSLQRIRVQLDCDGGRCPSTMQKTGLTSTRTETLSLRNSSHSFQLVRLVMPLLKSKICQ